MDNETESILLGIVSKAHNKTRIYPRVGVYPETIRLVYAGEELMLCENESCVDYHIVTAITYDCKLKETSFVTSKKVFITKRECVSISFKTYKGSDPEAVIVFQRSASFPAIRKILPIFGEAYQLEGSGIDRWVKHVLGAYYYDAVDRLEVKT